MGQHDVEICIKKIVSRKKWGNPKNWTTEKYHLLSDEITAVTKIRISSTSLRRLFGKDFYKDHYNPQIETKNALASYLGYIDWSDFLNRKKKKRSVVLRFGVSILVFLLSILLRDHQDIRTRPQFQTDKLFGNQAPHTVKIYYHINQYPDSVFIDFGDESLFHKGKKNFSFFGQG